MTTTIFIVSSPTFLGYGDWAVHIGGSNCLSSGHLHTCVITGELLNLSEL